MEAKEFLEQVKLCDLHIRQRLEERAKLEALATHITPNYEADVVQHGTTDKIGNVATTIVEIDREICEEVAKYKKIRKEVSEVVGMIQDADYVDVLYQRYFEYKKFEAIAEGMNLSKVWVFQLHTRALDEVDKIIHSET